MIYDVIIIGSGPAGSSSAYYLAKNNIKVLIIDKEKLPRYKTCGGGIVRRTLKNIPFEISPVIESFTYYAELIDEISGFHFRKKRSEAFISMTMRKDFDYLLLNKAVSAGAETRDNNEVKDISIKKDYCEISVNGSLFQSKFIIGADGATGITAKKSGWKDNRVLVPALEYEVYVKENLFEKYKNSTRFDLNAVPNGYGWIFPKKSHLSIGIASMKKANAKNLKNYLSNYLSKLGLTDCLNIEKHGYIIPLSFRNSYFAKDRVLLTGDAAGFADPLTGEGISYAVKSGQLAAKAIINGDMDVRLVSNEYNNLVYRNIVPELKAARKIAKIFYGPSFIRKTIFTLYGDKFCDLMIEIISGERNYSEMIKNPRNYFKLLNFKKYRNNKGILEDAYTYPQ
jgi:geranylgeranyl reductase family protein